MDNIAVKVSTDINQVVVALFLSTGRLKFTLKEHVDTQEYEAPIMVHTHRSS